MFTGTHVVLNKSRIPGSRGKGKDNAREGKGARWKGLEEKQISQMEGADPEKAIIINVRWSLGIGEKIITQISGWPGLYTGGMLSLQVL